MSLRLKSVILRKGVFRMVANSQYAAKKMMIRRRARLRFLRLVKSNRENNPKSAICISSMRKDAPKLPTNAISSIRRRNMRC